jgi:hypothetical protein
MRHWMDLTGSWCSPVFALCENVNEFSDFIQAWNFLTIWATVTLLRTLRGDNHYRFKADWHILIATLPASMRKPHLKPRIIPICNRQRCLSRTISSQGKKHARKGTSKGQLLISYVKHESKLILTKYMVHYSISLHQIHTKETVW